MSLRIHKFFFCIFLSIIWDLVPLNAQTDLYWVELESLPKIDLAMQLARDESSRDVPIIVFRTADNEYALASGPYESTTARSIMFMLLNDPNFFWSRVRLVSGDNYLEQIWSDSHTGESVSILENIENNDLRTGLSVIFDNNSSLPTRKFINDNNQQTFQQNPTPLEFTLIDDVAFGEPLYQKPSNDILIQLALRILGYYKGDIDGIYGRGTQRAIRNFQTDYGYKKSDALTDDQLEKLLSIYEKKHGNLNFQWLDSLEYGIRVLMPTGLLKYEGVDPPYVSYISPGYKNITLQLISIRGDKSMLKSIYQGLLAHAEIPEDIGKVGQNGFVIRYSDFDKYISSRAIIVDEARIRGIMVTWPTHQSNWFSDLADIMVSSLEETNNRTLDISAALDMSDKTQLVLEQTHLYEPKKTGSGFYVTNNGDVITSYNNVYNCNEITVDYSQQYELGAINRDYDLALLKPRQSVVPLSYAQFSNDPVRDRNVLAYAGYSFGGLLGKPTISQGRVTSTNYNINGTPSLVIDIDARHGDIGAPVVDQYGRIVGMLIQNKSDTGSNFNGTRHAITSDILINFIKGSNIEADIDPYSESLDTNEFARKISEYTALISCY